MLRKSLIPMLILPILALSACGDDDSNPMSAPSAGVSFVRVSHLSPDAPNVDVWVDGSRVLEDVPFRAVSGYLEVPAGEHRVQVTATGTTSPSVIDAMVTLTEDTAYTVAATGRLAEIAPTVLVDDRTAPAAGTTHVRFVHASPDAPPVDVKVANGGPTIFADTAFRAFAGYSPVAAGTYDLEVRLSSDDALVLTVPGVQFSGATNVTIFAIGLAGNSTLAALPVIDTP